MATGRAGRWRPGMFKTEAEKLASGIWPWESGVRARLPTHFKNRYMELHSRQPAPVHYRPVPGKWQLNASGERVPVQNIPIPLIFPEESQHGLWGGEGIIEGFHLPNANPYNQAIPRLYKPKTMKRIFYSEILNKWMAITVTPTTLQKIDEAYGFDFYILKAHAVDLQSRLGMRLKRAMLLKVIQSDLYPDNPEKNEHLCEKYRDFVIPVEEADWVGLTLVEAEIKQEDLEEVQRKAQLRPLKEVYMEQLLEDLEHDKYDFHEKEGWLSKMNPFHSEKSSTAN